MGRSYALLIDKRDRSYNPLMAPEMIRYEREKLFEEVWAEPMLAVAARYGVSSVALAKTCRKLGVPTPPRGYWALKAAGRTGVKPRLPAPKAGQ